MSAFGSKQQVQEISVAEAMISVSRGHVSSAIYRVIHKSLRDFRTRLRNNQDRHGRKEHINR